MPHEPRDYDAAERQIEKLINKLMAGKLCPCCVGRALMANGAGLIAARIGTAAAIEDLEDLTGMMREEAEGAPEQGTPMN
jgi:hypothetical protein